jgi:transcription-repair coupling factor (superfamily II helicase)
MDNKKKYTCSCGIILAKSSKAKHIISNIHFDNLKNNHERNELNKELEDKIKELETKIETLMKVFEITIKCAGINP